MGEHVEFSGLDVLSNTKLCQCTDILRDYIVCENFERKHSLILRITHWILVVANYNNPRHGYLAAIHKPYCFIPFARYFSFITDATSLAVGEGK